MDVRSGCAGVQGAGRLLCAKTLVQRQLQLAHGIDRVLAEAGSDSLLL